jgi:hypothetical protein
MRSGTVSTIPPAMPRPARLSCAVRRTGPPSSQAERGGRARARRLLVMLTEVLYFNFINELIPALNGIGQFRQFFGSLRAGGRLVRVRVVMQDKKNDFYDEAHLLVAAIRIFRHLNTRPPTVEDLCRTIHISIERGNLICRKLEELDIIEAVAGSYGVRWYVKEHLKIEDIPRGEPESKLEDELKKFQDSQKALSQKIETMQAEQKQKKKNLFADMEKKLKEELEKKRKK